MKSKKVRAKPPRYWMWGIIAVTLCLVATRLWKQANEREERKIWNTVADLATIDAQRSRTVDNWWMRTTNPPATMEVKQLLENKKDEVLSTIRNRRGISMETERIAARFQEFRLNIFVNDKAMHLNEDGITPSLGTNGIEISFVPEESARTILRYSLSWWPSWNMIIMPAINYPEKIRTALLFHELGHALRHNKNDHGMLAATHTKEGVLIEEIEIYQLNADILNAISQGKYYRLIDEILSRHVHERRFERIITSLTPQDKDAFDAMFDCRGTEVASKMIATQYITLIGFRHAEKNRLGMSGKVAVFKKVEQLTNR